MAVLSKNELSRRLTTVLPATRELNKERIKKQQTNTKTIYELDRDSLKYDAFERRLLVYSTLLQEKIYIEYPGKESVSSTPMIKDTCPGLSKDETMISLDSSFGDIWDVLDYLGKNHKAYLPVLAAVLLHMSCMDVYKLKTSHRECYDIEVFQDDRTYRRTTDISATFYELSFSKRIWETLNDMFPGICIKGQTMSFEAFIKYFDVLLMNEDSKYAYKAISAGKATYDTWKYKHGRVNTIGTCLNVINYLKDSISISSLLNGFQKGRGPIGFSVTRYASVTEGIITQADNNCA